MPRNLSINGNGLIAYILTSFQDMFNIITSNSPYDETVLIADYINK